MCGTLHTYVLRNSTPKLHTSVHPAGKCKMQCLNSKTQCTAYKTTNLTAHHRRGIFRSNQSTRPRSRVGFANSAVCRDSLDNIGFLSKLPRRGDGCRAKFFKKIFGDANSTDSDNCWEEGSNSEWDCCFPEDLLEGEITSTVGVQRMQLTVIE